MDLKCLWLDSVEHFLNEKWSKFNGHQFGLEIFAKQPPADFITIGNTMTSLPEHKTLSRLCSVAETPQKLIFESLKEWSISLQIFNKTNTGEKT